MGVDGSRTAEVPTPSEERMDLVSRNAGVGGLGMVVDPTGSASLTDPLQRELRVLRDMLFTARSSL